MPRSAVLFNLQFLLYRLNYPCFFVQTAEKKSVNKKSIDFLIKLYYNQVKDKDVHGAPL